MSSFLYIKFDGYSSEKIVNKLVSINVDIYDLQSVGSQIYVKILSKDYSKITKYLKTIECTKVKYTGYEYVKKVFTQYKIIWIALLISLCLVLFCSLFIVDITVVHEDEGLVKIVLDELEGYGVKKFGLKKSYNDLQRIKQEIKNKHLDIIDWLEINQVGMTYVIRIEERVVTSPQNEPEYCGIYAQKDGLIRKVKVFSGESVVEINDYVKKGDLLISGDIKLNNQIVSQVCAEGKIYAEVWYEINLQIPLNYYEINKTGKKRNNFVINYNGIDYQLFKDRIQDYKSNKKEIFDLLGIKIYLKEDYEIIKEKRTYTEREAIEKAKHLAFEKVKLKLKDTDKIISQKILQNSVIDSTMDIDIFIVAEEEISSQVELRKEIQNGL